jgi:hypothetical protein
MPCPNVGSEPPTIEDYRDELALAFEGVLRNFRDPAPDELEYRAIVEKYYQQGLEALSPYETRALLVAAQAAFLSHARTLRYSLVTEEVGARTMEGVPGDATLEEVVPYPGVLGVLRRRIVGSGVDWPATDVPSAAPAPLAHERIEFLGNRPEHGGALSVTAWDKLDGRWTCTVMRSTQGILEMAAMGRPRNFARYALGEFVGLDTVNGRRAYKLGPAGAGDITYWLDPDTLWLIQYEYERYGVRYLVELEAINEDIRIEPPDVNVECVEEDASPTATP